MMLKQYIIPFRKCLGSELMSHYAIMSHYDVNSYYKEIAKNTYDEKDVRNLLAKIKASIPKNQPIIIQPTLLGLGKFAGVGKKASKIANTWYEILSDELRDYPWALPAFSYNFLRTRSFNPATSPCDLCMLSQQALAQNLENRTYDPVFSYTLLGNMDFWHDHGYFDLNIQDNIINPFGKDSFFDKFTKANGNIMIVSYMELCTDFFTYVHYLENKAGVEYRYYKNFNGILETHNESHTNENKREIIYKYFVKPMDLATKYKESFITDYAHETFILGSEEHKFNKVILSNTQELMKNLPYLENRDLSILSQDTQDDIRALKEKVGYPFTLENCG